VLQGEHDPLWIYNAAKTIAEQEIWKFADEHPEVDITTINPSCIYGPLSKWTKVPDGALASFSTIGMFYASVLSGGKLHDPQPFPPPITVDGRDVARAHILALRSPPASEVGRKRLLVSGPNFTWKDAVEHLAKVRPELKDRLPDSSEAKEVQTASVDVSRAKEVLGLHSYVDWRKTVEDAVESLLAIEKSWTDVSEKK